MKATPGPWSAGGTIYKHMDAEIRQGKRGELGEPIAQVWAGPHSYANATLIAAVPDLLAVVTLVNLYVLRGEPCPICSGAPHASGCGLVAAIAKAEGRS